MNLEKLPVRWAMLVGLLAIIPVLWYGFGQSSTAGYISAINVVLIIATMYVATQAVDGDGHHEDSDSSA